MYIIYCMEAHVSHYEGEVDVKKKKNVLFFIKT